MDRDRRRRSGQNPDVAKLHRAVLPLLVAAVAVSCSGDDDSGSGHPPTADGLAAAAKQQAQAFIDEPGDTYQYLSADCRARLTRSDWAGELLLASGFFETFAGFELAEATVGDVEVRFVDGESGEALVEFLDPDGDPLDGQDFSVFVYEDGDWRSTDCDTFDDGGSAQDDEGWIDLGDGGDGEPPNTTYGGELRPAAEVLEDEMRAAARTGALGEPVELYTGLTIVVSAIERSEALVPPLGAEAPEDEYVIDVKIRAENRIDEELTNPDVSVACATGVVAGTFYLDSSFEIYGDLPARSFAEGVVTLSVPLDCVEPVVRVSDYDYWGDDPWGDDEEVAIDWAVPADAHP